MKKPETPLTFTDVYRYMNTSHICNQDQKDYLTEYADVARPAYEECMKYGIEQFKKDLLNASLNLRDRNIVQFSCEPEQYKRDEKFSDFVMAALKKADGSVADHEAVEKQLSDVFIYTKAEYKSGYIAGMYDLIFRTF